MLSASWRDDPERVWCFHLSRLCIDEQYAYAGMTVSRRSSCCFEIERDGKRAGTVMRHTYAAALHAIVQAVMSNRIELRDNERCKVPGCPHPRRTDTTYWLCDEHMREYWRQQKADIRAGLTRRHLDEDKVRDIRQMLAVGVSKPEIAEHFGVSVWTLYKIAQRRSWKDVA